jgi:hypothetical protein
MEKVAICTKYRKLLAENSVSSIAVGPAHKNKPILHNAGNKSVGGECRKA